MRLWLLTGVIGLAGGIGLMRMVTAGRMGWRRDPPLLWIPVGVVGMGLLVASSWVSGDSFVALRTVATAALVAVGLVNHGRRGARLLTAGVVANGLVVIANAGMPVAADAVVAAGGPPGGVLDLGRFDLQTDATVLPWLADTLGIGWLHVVVSPGDLLVAAGAVVVIATTLADLAMRQAVPTRPLPQSAHESTSTPDRSTSVFVDSFPTPDPTSETVSTTTRP
ncbi:MAG TPA: DUF5317 family protein [Nitriliruptoraceae bacterium]|nr:DUF5317 family protein [Nitriliruptoraceae bacterium]